VGPLRGVNSSFFVNFCNASLAGSPCYPNHPAHVCASEDTGVKRRDWGGYLDFSPMALPIISQSGNVSYELSFALGDSAGCPAGGQRTAIFKFKCDTSTVGIALYDPTDPDTDECTAVFEWNGSLGCPLCQPYDYDTLLGPCAEGMRTVQQIRKSDCNGQTIIPAPSQSCSGTVEFPIAVVFVIIGVILVLVVAAVIVFIKNRRISAQYSRLKQQTHTSMETTTDANL